MYWIIKVNSWHLDIVRSIIPPKGRVGGPYTYKKAREMRKKLYKSNNF